MSRGAATGGYVPPPTLKSMGTFYVLVPLTFSTSFILIGWSPYIQNRSRAPTYEILDLTLNNT